MPSNYRERRTKKERESSQYGGVLMEFVFCKQKGWWVNFVIDINGCIFCISFGMIYFAFIIMFTIQKSVYIYIYIYYIYIIIIINNNNYYYYY